MTPAVMFLPHLSPQSGRSPDDDHPFASATYYSTSSPGNPYRSYTVYEVRLNEGIIRRKDNAALFEGRAQLRSDDGWVGPAVPKLLQKVFADRSTSLR